MIHLPNGCRCSEPTLNDKNETWYLQYWFYDPSITDASGRIKPKLFLVKGMNHFKKPAEKKEAARRIKEELLSILKEEGYNPITGQRVKQESDYEISPMTPLPIALEQCAERLSCAKRTRADILSNLNFIKPACTQLRLDHVPIKDIRRRHIKAILNRLAETKEHWSNNTFNAYRKNLWILFTELIEFEATEVNPVHGIKRKKHAPKKRKILTPEECQKIDDFARNYDIRFWLLIHIFYHSGSRTTEMFKVQGKHVNLIKQSVTYMVLKGRDYEWIERPIKNIALPLWETALADCGPDDFVFSAGLKPGPKAIRPDQITKRWKRHIKDKLKIDANWYDLKFLNTTTTINFLELQRSLKESTNLAAAQNGHKSEAMVVKIYDVDRQSRQHKELKEVVNPFAS